MGFEPAVKALVVALVISSFILNVFAIEEDVLSEHYHGHHGPAMSPHHEPSPSPDHHHEHHHKHHPPMHPPSMPPSHPPMKPPSHPPMKPPSHPPMKPPSHPPMKPPSHPPMKPPSYPPIPRKLVAVQGVVYCKSCKYQGVATLLGASPLTGAVVELECKNTKYPLKVHGQTDKNGYFFIQAPKSITSYAAHTCKVSLVSSPNKTCNTPTDLDGGISGSALRLEKGSVSKPTPFALYTAGPFAFEAAKGVKCT